MFEEFEKSHQEAIRSIKTFLEDDYYKDMQDLAKWLLTTDTNPFSFLPETWAISGYNSAQGFYGLLRFISHAVYDDGDISFITVNEEPRIVFMNKHYIDEKNVLSETERFSLEKSVPFWKPTYEVKILDITPNEFGRLYDEWHSKWIRQCFMNDASTFGDAEESAQHYRVYACWNESWIKEYKDENESTPEN